MTISRTPAELAHRRVVRFFWVWLTLTTSVSVAGNVAHAWFTASSSGNSALAVSVAVVPPVVLLLAVHGVAVLAKLTASGAIYRVAVAATAVLAVGAFVLSFVALRDLAVIAGIRPGLAPVLPLVIDVAIGVATLALAAVGDKPARRSRTASKAAMTPAAPAASESPAAATGQRTSAKAASPADGAAVVAPTVRQDVGAATRELAAELVAAKVTRQSVAVVEQILAAHTAGNPTNRIAKDLGVHHSAVTRVIEAVTERRERSMDAA